MVSSHGGGGITIGEDCGIRDFAYIVSMSGDITIGNHNFDRVDIPICLQGETSIGIAIEDDVWIGADCRILDGVTIGQGSVIGAGSVVTRSIPPYSVAMGVPAKVTRQRRENRILESDNEHLIS